MKGRGAAGAQTVDAYLENLPPAYRATLQKLRRTIRAAAPEAEEVMSYRMPAFRLQGMLVYYAAFRDHCSFFVGGPLTRKEFLEELKPFASGKGTYRFTPDRPIPERLVTRIVKARVAENKARAEEKVRRSASSPKRRR